MNVSFQASIPKDTAHPDSNEDVLRIADDLRAIVLCDGATESYDSRTWANIVASTYLESAEFSAECLKAAVRAYQEAFKRDEFSWAQLAAFERGSFSTILGIRYFPDFQSMQIVAVGDSFCALLDGDRVLSTFPYVEPAEFDARPHLISTVHEQNRVIFDEAGFVGRRVVWQLDKSPSLRVLCMSDALGRWFLDCSARGDEEGINAMLTCEDGVAFAAFVLALREDHAIKYDDTTLAVIDGF